MFYLTPSQNSCDAHFILAKRSLSIDVIQKQSNVSQYIKICHVKPSSEHLNMPQVLLHPPPEFQATLLQQFEETV